MTGEDPLLFVPLAKGSSKRSKGRVGEWVRSWWKDSKREQPWGDTPLTEVTKDNLFDLHKVEGPRLWMPPPTSMETVMEVFNKDRMAHPRRTHVFVVPMLMTHLWRLHLGKDVDILMTITAEDHFWEKSQHEPRILAIVLPFAYVETYRGPWDAHGLENLNLFGKNSKLVSRLLGAGVPRNFLTWMGGCVECGKTRRG